MKSICYISLVWRLLFSAVPGLLRWTISSLNIATHEIRKHRALSCSNVQGLNRRDSALSEAVMSTPQPIQDAG